MQRTVSEYEKNKLRESNGNRFVCFEAGCSFSTNSALLAEEHRHGTQSASGPFSHMILDQNPQAERECLNS